MRRKAFLQKGLLLIGGWAAFSCIPKTMSSNISISKKSPSLGLKYQPDASTFALWAPNAEAVRLHMYKDRLVQTVQLAKEENDIWSVRLVGNWVGHSYTFQIRHNGIWMEERVDPYARAVTVNGKRGAVLDAASVSPPNWTDDRPPPLAHKSEAIIYELHIRDLSMDPDAGIEQAGLFLGLAEEGTRSPQGLSTGLDHIRELGVTHVHLLPIFDFRSVDENRRDQYNWGYDPQHYNVPEGSYSTEPQQPARRLLELKTMIQVLHKAGLRVVMDVVYNHTGYTEESLFYQLAPGIYHRMRPDGTFSNGSGCGNEIASERPMVRKMIIDSLLYWVEEYHIDGFRFDLMGLHDLETMREIERVLLERDPTLLLYGEGWTGGESTLPETDRALKHRIQELPGISAFSDDLRDAIKGNVFNHHDRGFASGQDGWKESLQFGIVGAVSHPQIDMEKVRYSGTPWAGAPTQSIAYVSCHDNHTLFDKLEISVPDATPEERIQMHILAYTIVLTSQGIPFLHAGGEFLRSKGGEENSYRSPDSVNRIRWAQKSTYQEVHDYYKALIALRKAHPAFRMKTAEQVQEHLEFLPSDSDRFFAYRLKEHANGDDWKEILIAFNGDSVAHSLSLPQGEWFLVADGKKVAVRRASVSGDVQVPARSGYIWMRGDGQ
ncbi:MAG: type I pullulanase [Myxococcota bacterium]|nr:type I pullulanase [Myxococcota bacterium]